MTVLRDAVADYLTIRRALGYKLVEHQRLLNDFAALLEQAGAGTITTELALAWAVRCRGTEGWKAERLSVIRGFAGYLRNDRSGDRDPAYRVVAPPQAIRGPVPVLRSRDRPAARQGGGAEAAAASGHLLHAARAARGGRNADRRWLAGLLGGEAEHQHQPCCSSGGP
jgi:hypothetical protein